MASASKRSRVDLTPLDEALERIFNEEDSADGMESGEESDLDRQLENETGESRWVFDSSLSTAFNFAKATPSTLLLKCKDKLFRLPFCI